MKWDSIFDSMIRMRGQQYYAAGKVKNLQYEDGWYTASVYGERMYAVSIRIQDNKIQKMECNCPHALSGARCKHMAAVLIAIEHQRKNMQLRESRAEKLGNLKKAEEIEENEPPVCSFSKEVWNPEGNYYYFDMSVIAGNLHFTKKIREEAAKLIRSKSVVLKSVDTRYLSSSSTGEQIAVARGELPLRSGRYGVTLMVNRNHITDARCEVPGCPYYYFINSSFYGKTEESRLCVHEVALLQMLGDYIHKYNPGDATDWGGEKLLRQYRRLRTRRSEEREPVDEQKLLQVEPRLEKSDRGLQVSFKIGYGSNYVVRNLTELVRQVENRETVIYGKNLTVNFGTARFSPRGAQYLSFIENCIREEKYRKEELQSKYRYGEIPDMTVKGQLLLQGSRLDQFSQLLGEDEISYVDPERKRTGKYDLKQREGKPSVNLTVQEDQGPQEEFQGVKVTGKLPLLWHGLHYDYYEDGRYLNRVPRENMEKLVPLYEAADQDGTVFFRVGRKYLSEFCYSTLPELRELVTVEEPDRDKIDSYLPPEAAFCFYLDAPGQNVTCRVTASYGDREESVTDWFREPADTEKETYRDRNREEEILSEVMEYLPYLEEKEGFFHCDGEEEKIYDLLEYGVNRFLELGEVRSTDRFRHLNIHRKTKVTVGVSLDSDIMNLEIASQGISNEELLELLNSYRQKKKYYRLKNGDFMKIDQDTVDALGQIMETLHVSLKDFVKGKMRVPVYRALYLDQMLKENETIYSNRDSHFRELVKAFKTVGDSDFAVPKSLQEILRNYQIVGYQWLRTLDANGFGGILADDMGLGKTLQMITVLLAYHQENASWAGNSENRTSLIITPASLVYNWQEELSHYAPELSVGLIVGTQPERREKIKAYQNYDVLVTSYDLLKRDIAEYEECHFAYQVIDEAQYIKNHTTAAAKAVKIIHSRTRYALTGTPIENRLSELWSIFDYLMPGFLYEYGTFRSELEIPITKEKEETATQRLRRMVAPFILRRCKQDVLKDLPEKLEEVQYARMGATQQRLYDAQVLHMRELLENETDEAYERNKIQVLAELTRIRQICCDPALFLENYDGESAKREACMDRVRSAIEGEHKILLFSQFTSMLELLEKDLKAEGISYYKIIGATPKEQRMELVRRFNQDDTPVFLISLKAGGTGLNLTGADVVIHYDPWWNQAVQNQATDRAHRIGQKRIVSVYQLIVKDSIEEKIQKMQEAKKNLADEILGGEVGGLAKLGRKELLELFEG